MDSLAGIRQHPRRKNMKIKHLSLLILTASLLLSSGCGKGSFKPNLSTPESAILSLEEAYRRGNVDQAIACKDFKAEAAWMTRDKPEMNTPAILAKLAETLELAYRAEMKANMPDFKGVTSRFPQKMDLEEGKVVVTEICKLKDGTISTQNLLVAKTDTGWKVMIPIH